jgi:hypothetical protein
MIIPRRLLIPLLVRDLGGLGNTVLIEGTLAQVNSEPIEQKIALISKQ